MNFVVEVIWLPHHHGIEIIDQSKKALYLSHIMTRCVEIRSIWRDRAMCALEDALNKPKTVTSRATSLGWKSQKAGYRPVVGRRLS